MTCIAVKKFKKEIVLAADSQSTWGYLKTHRKEPKIFEKDGLHFGFSGAGRVSSLVRRSFKAPKKLEDQTLDDILELYVNSFRDLLGNSGAKENDKGVEKSSFTGIMIAEGRAFVICHDFSLTEIDEYFSIGSGMEVAMGALFAGVTPEFAVRAAIEHAVGCGGDVYEIRIPI